MIDSLTRGLVAGFSHPIISYSLYRHRHNHWVYLMRDRTALDPQFENDKNYILRSEILAVVAIFFN